MYGTIVLPVDYGRASNELAAVNAFELAKAFDGTIHAVYVRLRAEQQAHTEEQADVPFDHVKDIADRCDFEGEIEYVPLTGKPKVEICEYAEEIMADVVVMATHGRTGVERLAWGSVTENVIRNAPCPVLTMTNDE